MRNENDVIQASALHQFGIVTLTKKVKVEGLKKSESENQKVTIILTTKVKGKYVSGMKMTSSVLQRCISSASSPWP